MRLSSILFAVYAGVFVVNTSRADFVPSHFASQVGVDEPAIVEILAEEPRALERVAVLDAFGVFTGEVLPAEAAAPAADIVLAIEPPIVIDLTAAILAEAETALASADPLAPHHFLDPQAEETSLLIAADIERAGDFATGSVAAGPEGQPLLLNEAPAVTPAASEPAPRLLDVEIPTEL